jgi:ATP-binding cassette subfamily D (ALD) long-chain fatty acid import protein
MGDHGDEWDFQRIGTKSEKSSVEKELAELRERLSKVQEWKKRRQEIEEELNRVWVEGKDGERQEELPPPSYLKSEDVTKAIHVGLHEW